MGCKKGYTVEKTEQQGVIPAEIALSDFAYETERSVSALRVSEDGVEKRLETIATETQVDIYVNGTYWASSSLTPLDLIDYGYGIMHAAGLAANACDIAAIEKVDGKQGIELYVSLQNSAFAPLTQSLHHANTTVAAVLSTIAPNPAAPKVTTASDHLILQPQAIWCMARSLLSDQGMHRSTGATHAAAFANKEGKALIIREDLGRHNAVDKLVGALLRADIDPADGFVYLSSRCALELVSKLYRVGVRVVATVSAPTSAAIDFTEAHNMTLCAFAREGRFTVYAHPERIQL